MRNRTEIPNFPLKKQNFNTLRAGIFEVITSRPLRGSYTPHVARNVLTWLYLYDSLN